MSRRWFSYVGPIGGELSAANYVLTQVLPTCLQGSQNVCTVYAIYQPQPYGLHPVPFGVNLNRYISDLKATGVAQPMMIGLKKYVYAYPL